MDRDRPGAILLLSALKGWLAYKKMFSFKKWKLYGTMKKDLYRGSFIYTHKHLPTASVLQGSPGGKAFLHAHCHYLWLSATSLHSQ